MPAKRLKISKKTNSKEMRKELTVSTFSLVELQKLRKRKPIRFYKMNRWGNVEKYQFYKGLKAFGLDFDMMNKSLLPHRSEKEIFAFFKSQDKRNSLRIDSCLDWFRKHSLYKKDNNQLDAYSNYDFSLDDTSAECTECNILKSKLNLGSIDIPSLDSVLEETKFLEI